VSLIMPGQCTFCQEPACPLPALPRRWSGDGRRSVEPRSGSAVFDGLTPNDGSLPHIGSPDAPLGSTHTVRLNCRGSGASTRSLA